MNGDARQSAAERATSSARLHYLDRLRAGLMLMGIPLHAGQAWTHGQGPVKASKKSWVIDVIIAFIHQWRMPLFFVLAGYFALLIMRRRGPGLWFRDRLRRLGLPLVFGVTLVLPTIVAIVAVDRGRTDYWNVARETGVVHLWFLEVLLVYCAVLALVGLVSRSRRQVRRAGKLLDRAMWSTPGFLIGTVAMSVLVMAGLLVWRGTGLEHLFDGLVTRDLFVYAPYFALGVLLALMPDNLDRLQLLSKAALMATAILAFVGVLAFETFQHPNSSVAQATRTLCWIVGGSCWSALALAWASRAAWHRSDFISWLVDASVVIYIVQMPLVLALQIWVISAGWPPMAGWLVVTLLALIGSALIYEVINRIPGLRYLAQGRARPGVSLLHVAAMR